MRRKKINAEGRRDTEDTEKNRKKRRKKGQTEAVRFSTRGVGRREG